MAACFAALLGGIAHRSLGRRFASAWRRRIRSRYGRAPANWIHLDDLLRIKSRIPNPRHQEDARVLREVKRMKRRR